MKKEDKITLFFHNIYKYVTLSIIIAILNFNPKIGKKGYLKSNIGKLKSKSN